MYRLYQIKGNFIIIGDTVVDVADPDTKLIIEHLILKIIEKNTFCFWMEPLTTTAQNWSQINSPQNKLSKNSSN